MEPVQAKEISGARFDFEIVGRLMRVKVKSSRIYIWHYWPIEWVSFNLYERRPVESTFRNVIFALYVFSAAIIGIAVGAVIYVSEMENNASLKVNPMALKVGYSVFVATALWFGWFLHKHWYGKGKAVALVFNNPNGQNFHYSFWAPKELDAPLYRLVKYVDLARSAPTDLTYNHVIKAYSRSSITVFQEFVYPLAGYIIAGVFAGSIAAALVDGRFAPDHRDVPPGPYFVLTFNVVACLPLLFHLVRTCWRRVWFLRYPKPLRKAAWELHRGEPAMALETLRAWPGAKDRIEAGRVCFEASLMQADLRSAMGAVAVIAALKEDEGTAATEVINEYRPLFERALLPPFGEPAGDEAG